MFPRRRLPAGPPSDPQVGLPVVEEPYVQQVPGVQAVELVVEPLRPSEVPGQEVVVSGFSGVVAEDLDEVASP